MPEYRLTFEPYLRYKENLEYIGNFSELTTLAYGLIQQLLFKYPREQLPRIRLPKPKREDLSFSMGAQEVKSVKMKCSWLSFPKYAERCGLDLETVEARAREGKLGPIQRHPKTGNEVVAWPQEMQSKPLSELPEPGKSTFAVTITAEAHVPISVEPEDENDFEEAQQVFLSMAHSLGEPEKVAERAEELLYRSCFLLHWVMFEVFLRSTVHELIKRHPTKLTSTKQGKKPTLSYEDVVAMSGNLSSVEALRDSLTQREIERQQADGESVHGLINFLKSEFHFDRDPYEAWYILRGERHMTHYLDLMELKDVRNALVHDGGTPSESFFEKYPTVRRRDNNIIVDEEYYLKSRLILDSLAFGIAESIDKQKYDTGD